MKDQLTGETLLQGTIRDGLYCFFHIQPVKESSTSLSIFPNVHPQVFHSMLNFSCSMSNDVNIWHKRLGHPCPDVIKSIAKTL